MNAPIRLIRGFLTVGFWTMISRVLGVVREVLFAAYLGAGPAAEAFFIAFSLPNMFRRFFAEGAFNMAFVPMFARKLEGDENAGRFANEAMAALGTILIALTLVAQFAMPWLVYAMASGFGGDARFDLATDYGRVAFPYILFISLAALVSGVLNAAGRFLAAAAAPVLLNVFFVGAVGVATLRGWDMGLTLAWTVPVAGVAQLVFVWIAAARAGFRLRPRLPRLTPDMKRLALVAAPAALAGGVVQVNLLVDRQVASFFDGAVAWLYYSDRLYQLPLGVVGVAIGVVLLPDLARKLRAGDAAGGRAAFNRSTEFALALTIPSAVALVVIPLPLISVLFERGAFTPHDSQMTAAALGVYGAGLPAFVLQKVLQPLYFAREDTRTPFRFAVVAMVVNAVIAVGLIPVFGFLAAALGTTLAGWAMVWLLWRGAARMGDAARPDAGLRKRVTRITLSAIGMGVLLVLAAAFLAPWLSQPGWRYVALGALVTGGALSFLGLAVATGGIEAQALRTSRRG